MEFDLPEGFTVLEETNSVEPSTEFTLPEGFTVVEPEAPIDVVQQENNNLIQNSSLSSVLAGGEQPTNPFGQQEVQSNEPQLDLINQREVQPSLTPGEIRVDQAEQVVSNYENVFNKLSTTVKGLVGIDKEQVQQDVNIARTGLIEELSNQGFNNPQYIDDQLHIDIEGIPTEVSPSLLRDLGNSAYEIFGGGSGAGLGARVGAIAGPVGAFVGGVAGSAIGAAGGKYLDILTNKMYIIEETTDELVKDQVIESGLFDIAAGVIGTTIFKTGEVTYRGIKGVYDKVFAGNMDGAYEHAMKHFNITEDEAKELVTKFEDTLGAIEGTDKEKVIKVLTTTRAGGEAIVEKSAMFDPTASAQVANTVFKRAKDLKAASKELSTDNIQTIINQNLKPYTEGVKKFYSTVKSAGSEFTQDYKFDYEKLGLQPLIDDIGNKIENPIVKQRYLDLLTKVEDVTDNRTFEDLIDLRQLTNEIKFSTKSIKQTNKDALDNVITNIDKEISNVADVYIPDSKVWKGNWSKAKYEYSKMKQLENNVLYKAITKPGIDEKQVVKSLSKYISAGDNTFYEVMDKLPKNVRNRVDGAILDNMVERYSAGNIGGNRAVHFPQLAQELKKISWKNSNPKAKRLVRDINKMAEVFKNDVNLARVSGKLEIPRFQSYLTADPVVRMKYEFASSIFNYVKQLAPGDKSNALALLSNTAKLLENPLSSKSIKDLNNALPKDRRKFRETLNFDEQLSDLRNKYIERKEALKQIQGTDNIIPRLVWKQPKEQPVTNIPSGDTLSATERGTVSSSATKAVLQDRSDDLIAEFIQDQVLREGIRTRIGVMSPEGLYDKFVTKIDGYLSDKRLSSVLKSVRARLSIDDKLKNQQIIRNTIEAETNTLINRIEKDLGVTMPKDQADKLVRIKIKELSEENTSLKILIGENNE